MAGKESNPMQNGKKSPQRGEYPGGSGRIGQFFLEPFAPKCQI
jgi:hypothetical protein